MPGSPEKVTRAEGAPAPPGEAAGRGASPPGPASARPAAPRRGNPADPDSRQATRAPAVGYPLQEKYAALSLSAVPHQVVGAWDEAPNARSLGERRSFVLVVDPEIANRRLERLVRDVRKRHGDASSLSVRIYDSREAAITPAPVEGGAFDLSNLLAQLRRDPDGSEVMRVRGRRVQP